MFETTHRDPKIVCTLGPASDTDEIITKLLKAGMNVVRLNFSHGSHDYHRDLVSRIRKITRELQVSIAILQDLQGPKIRMSASIPEEGVSLNTGQQIVLSASKNQFPLSEALPVDYDLLDTDVRAGESILFADGRIIATVEKVADQKLFCTVKKGGTLFKRKGVNLPESSLQVPAMTPKDYEDLQLGIELDVDLIALSFIRKASDILPIKEALKKNKHPALLLGKIEKPQALENFSSILENLDGIMVARGDLGVEMPMEQVPAIQKQLIAEAREAGKFVITATQMLLSMVNSPLPTRAEVSDVANAMYDGTDAIMLSDETAAGEFPVEACEVMAKIATATSPHLLHVIKPNVPIEEDGESIAIGFAACTLARDTKAKFIVACTNSGRTARAISRFRPSCPIIGMTSQQKTFDQLNVFWGVIPVKNNFVMHTDDLFDEARRILYEKSFVKTGDLIVITAGVPLGSVSGKTNLLRLLQI